MLLLAQWLGGLLLLLLLAGIAIRLAYPLPPLEPRTVSRHLGDTGDTPLGRGAAALMEGHAGLYVERRARRLCGACPTSFS